MADNNQSANKEEKQTNQTPFQGNEGIIKNLATLSDGDNSNRESLLDQIVDTPQDNQPAPSKQGGNNDTQ